MNKSIRESVELSGLKWLEELRQNAEPNIIIMLADASEMPQIRRFFPCFSIPFRPFSPSVISNF
jgi:CheY-like chemotaxis protein